VHVCEYVYVYACYVGNMCSLFTRGFVRVFRLHTFICCGMFTDIYIQLPKKRLKALNRKCNNRVMRGTNRQDVPSETDVRTVELHERP
jgi:hypothetical protein